MMMNDVRNEGESFPVDAPQNFAEKTFKRFLWQLCGKRHTELY